MHCTRCGKKIREAYYVNGKPYGAECAKKRGYSDRKVVIRRPDSENEKQGNLF